MQPTRCFAVLAVEIVLGVCMQMRLVLPTPTPRPTTYTYDLPPLSYYELLPVSERLPTTYYLLLITYYLLYYLLPTTYDLLSNT